MTTKSAPGRIVTVSSLGHIFASIDPNNLNKPRAIDFQNYVNSKLCNILMSNELARKLEGTNVTSNCLHPGAIRTSIFRRWEWYQWLSMSFLYWFIFKNAKEGAETTIHCAVCEKVDGVSGKYFQDCKEYWTLPIARDKKLETCFPQLAVLQNDSHDSENTFSPVGFNICTTR
ncbi:retinol dehydrogenase 12-like [Chrysoperla carnea]|uniref:retinol dehydrogenase 12-like n=1 Tax=Chrysoperla carnea TaxID=189513 RepID=UPI001D097300|nr:retinol dehydrogenase 12-like [Chrysoperla carnea]